MTIGNIDYSSISSYKRDEANKALDRATTEVKTIQEALRMKRVKMDQLFDEAKNINELVEYVLENPKNGVISSEIRSTQKISDILLSLDDDLIQK